MKSTLIGSIAILLWSLLALLTAASGNIPPFQLLAMTFAIGSLVGLFFNAARGEKIEIKTLSWGVVLFGIAGLFGYHFLYYTALQNAPIAEASLIAYLWPLLIVFGSALLPGEQLRWYHIAGALLGFIGAGILLAGKAGPGGLSFGGQETALGFAAAFACAFVWSSYSVISRKFAKVPTSIVTLYCMATAVLSLGCHLLFEATVLPQSPTQWFAILGLGLGPVGFAFYAWDEGMKRGNIQLLGSGAYFAPVLSTIILVATGFAEASLALWTACLLVTLGAVIASGTLFGKSQTQAAGS